MKLRLVSAALLLFSLCAGSATGLSPRAHAATSHMYSSRHITISLARQRLRAWDGHTLVLSTLVTTGNRLLPTPVGRFTIFAKRSPYTFISPWPQGSPYYYPPSRVSFALEFRAGGYFIHDAPWRAVFGPGTNTVGSPGTNYGGTHGCINVPYNAARFLFDWAPLGTRVHVVP